MSTAISESLEEAQNAEPWMTPAAVVAHLLRLKERRRQAHALSKLDGDRLDDIGLTPRDVERELRRIGYLR